MQQLSGFCRVKIIAVNPDSLWLENNLSIEEEPIYEYESRGTRYCNLDFYFQDNKDNIFKSTIVLEDKLLEGKTNNFMYINQIGDTQWVKEEHQLFDGFKNWEKILSWEKDGEVSQKYVKGSKPHKKEIVAKKDYHIATKGEPELLNLLKAFNNYSNYDPEVNVFTDLNRLLEGDFSRLQRLINKDFSLVIFVYVSEKLEQKVLNHYFPLEFYRDVLNNMVISQYNKKYYEDFLKKLEYVSGYWELQKMQDFKPNLKKIEQNDSEY